MRRHRPGRIAEAADTLPWRDRKILLPLAAELAPRLEASGLHPAAFLLRAAAADAAAAREEILSATRYAGLRLHDLMVSLGIDPKDIARRYPEIAHAPGDEPDLVPMRTPPDDLAPLIAEASRIEQTLAALCWQARALLHDTPYRGYDVDLLETFVDPAGRTIEIVRLLSVDGNPLAEPERNALWAWWVDGWMMLDPMIGPDGGDVPSHWRPVGDTSWNKLRESGVDSGPYGSEAAARAALRACIEDEGRKAAKGG